MRAKRLTQTFFLGYVALLFVASVASTAHVVTFKRRGVDEASNVANLEDININATRDTSLHSPATELSIPNETQKQSDFNWSELPGAARELIMKTVFENFQNGKSLIESSKSIKELVEEEHYGSYIYLGRPDKFLNNGKICKELKANRKRYRQIRQVYVTFKVYRACEFNQEEMVNLESFNVLIHSSDAKKLHKYSSKMNLTNGVSETHINAGYAFFKELILIFNNSKVNVEVISSRGKASLAQNLLMTRSADGSIGSFQLLNEVLESGRVNVDFQDAKGNTLLHICMAPDLFSSVEHVLFNTTSCIETMLKHNANVSIQNNNLYSPTHIAAALTYNEPLKMMVRTGKANINRVNDEKYPPIHLAILNSPSEFRVTTPIEYLTTYMDLFLQKYDFQIEIPELFDELWIERYKQYKANQRTTLGWLIRQQNLDIRTKSYSSDTVLHTLIREGYQSEAFQIMIHREPQDLPINEIDYREFTPIFYAVKNGYVNLVRQLIGLHANVNHVSIAEKGHLVQINSLYTQNDEIYALLFENGFDINMHDDNVELPISIYLSRKPTLDGLDLFLSYGVDLIHSLNDENGKNYPMIRSVLMFLQDLHTRKSKENTLNAETETVFRNLMRKIIQQLPEPIEHQSEVDHDLTELEYFKLLYVTFSMDTFEGDLMDVLIPLIPFHIINRFEKHLYVSKKGLQFKTPLSSDKSNVFYSLNARDKDNIKFIISVMNDTPRLWKEVREIDGFRDLNLDTLKKAKNLRSIDIINDNIRCPFDHRECGAKATIMEIQKTFVNIQYIRITYPYEDNRYATWKH